MNNQEIADKIELLRSRNPKREEWYVKKEPHNHPDGTTHFNHVQCKCSDGMTVEIASYVTPELGELLCLLHNNLDTIVGALRK